MKQWRFLGLTSIVLLIPMLFIYYSISSGNFQPVTGIALFTCLDNESCPDIPRRNYKTIQLPLKTTNAETKLKDDIQRLGQIHDTIYGYHLVLNDLDIYEDFIKGINLCYGTEANIIHNEFGIWVYYPTESENKAYIKKLKKEWPGLGGPMTCK